MQFFRFSGTKAGVSSPTPSNVAENALASILLVVLMMHQILENVDLAKAIMKRHRGGEFEFARDAQEQKKLWSARKEALWSMLAVRPKGSDVWSTDVAVPLSRLSDIIGWWR